MPLLCVHRWRLGQQLVGAVAELISLQSLTLEGGAIDAAGMDLHVLTGARVWAYTRVRSLSRECARVSVLCEEGPGPIVAPIALVHAHTCAPVCTHIHKHAHARPHARSSCTLTAHILRSSSSFIPPHLKPLRLPRRACPQASRRLHSCASGHTPARASLTQTCCPAACPCWSKGTHPTVGRPPKRTWRSLHLRLDLRDCQRSRSCVCLNSGAAQRA